MLQKVTPSSRTTEEVRVGGLEVQQKHRLCLVGDLNPLFNS